MTDEVPIVTVIDDRRKTKQKAPSIIIHDDIKRTIKTPLHYTMKAISTGRKDRRGKIGIKEYHLFISKEQPKQSSECYLFAPVVLFNGDQLRIDLLKSTGEKDNPDNFMMSPCAFIDKDVVRDVTGKP